MKAAGFTEDELQQDQPLGPMVFSYTRAQAIEDGVLQDLGQSPEIAALVREAGFKIPVAMTSTAFHDTVLAGTTETPDGEFVFPAGQSVKGRLWDVLMLLRLAIRKLPEGEDRCFFKVDVDEKGDGQHTTVSLWALIGPGDEGEAVLTLMLEGED